MNNEDINLAEIQIDSDRPNTIRALVSADYSQTPETNFSNQLGWTLNTEQIKNVETKNTPLEIKKDPGSKMDNKVLGNKDYSILGEKISSSDEERLKVIKNDEKRSSLKNPRKFWFIVLWICLNKFTVGFNQGFIGAFVVTITNKKNFDWEKGSTEYLTNVSLLTSLYFLGCAIATCTQSLFLKMNQRKLLNLLQVVTILISLLSCFDNFYTFILARVLTGYIAGLLWRIIS